MPATKLRRSPRTALEGVVPDRVLFSPWLKRLSRISFLGALDHAPACRQRPSRLDHSTGAAILALQAGRSCRLDARELALLVTATLLHDVGHYPLSHTAEPAFRSLFGADHHALTRSVILGGGPVRPDAYLAPALADAGLDPERAWSLIAGEDASPLAPLLAGAINVDTLDGIPRAARAFGLRVPSLPDRPFALRGGTLFARREALAALDRFWRLKDRVYRDVINAPAHAALELRLSALVGRAVDARAFDALPTWDDAALLRQLALPADALAPDADETRSRYATSADPALHPVRIRREYVVDERVTGGADGLPWSDWPRRWTTRKHRWFLVTPSRSVQLLLPGCWETEGDLP